ncbi:MAG: zf-TFIIB domain-containing protein [Bradymonadaceae bacterium]
MDCPVCDNELTPVMVDLPGDGKWGEMELDVCDGGCGGIWFDRFELDKVDDPTDAPGDVALDVERDPSIEIDHDADRDCPACSDIVMMKKFYTVRREVEIDECGGCGGVWLDPGELDNLRQQFESDEAREEAAEAAFDEMFAEELDKRESEGGAGETISRALRFILPSYWIPGDQEGAPY